MAYKGKYIPKNPQKSPPPPVPPPPEKEISSGFQARQGWTLPCVEHGAARREEGAARLRRHEPVDEEHEGIMKHRDGPEHDGQRVVSDVEVVRHHAVSLDADGEVGEHGEEVVEEVPD